MTHRGRRQGITLSAAALAAAVAVGTAAPGTAFAATDDRPPGAPAAGDAHDHDHLPDVDVRKAKAAPSAAQQAAAASSRNQRGSGGGAVTWNRLGSVGSITPSGTTPLATGLGSDPLVAARAYLVENAAAFGVTAADITAMQHVSTNKIGDTSVVMLRQTFGGVEAGIDGLVVVAVDNGSARYVSSTLAPVRGKSAARRAAPSLSAEQALAKAAANVGARATGITRGGAASKSKSKEAGWTALTAKGLVGEQTAKLVAIPVPGGDARTAYQVVVRDHADSGYSVYVDAAHGEVIARESLVDFDSDNPRWKVFTGTPATDHSSTDTRVEWCWTTAAGCAETVANPASPKPWDVDPATNLSTTTTSGNNAFSGERWLGVGTVNPATPKSDRNYVYPWTNQWSTSKCDPASYTSGARNDIDAATTNLFAMHNRMHDWSYQLGFTESAWNFQRDNAGKGGVGNDPVLGFSQSGALAGARNNANFGTPPEGTSGYSNMYLWQPLAGAFYAPCVDGDFDMSVIGHEYGHGISNRMAGGPNSGLSGLQAGAMGESWSDLMATEYLQEWGYVPVSATAIPMASYATGNENRGIRNYNFSKSPLNYSNVGYDLTGPQVHADGEIWSATHSDIRSAFIGRYGAGDAALQRSCATGATAATACPGNRRWMQLVFDAWLLMPSGSVSMVDARNAMLAADLLRFGGANQDILWNGFAGRGLGQGASSVNSADSNPTPSFTSAYGDPATLRFSPTDEDGRPVTGAQLFVGEYTARSTPIADTDGASALGDTFQILPGARTYTVLAPGRAQTTFSFSANPRQTRDLPVRLLTNLASSQAGATVTGVGNDVPAMIDGDEGSTTTTVAAPTAAQKQFTIDLAGGRQVVRRVQVSALPEPGAAGRFQNVRQFTVFACDARGRVLCNQDADFRPVFTSTPDAFPGAAPRPVAPELKMRSFAIPQTAATHLRIGLATNQCQGGPEFAGEQDNDPANATDCTSAYAGAQLIAVSEVQVLQR
ncbi:MULTISPECIES: M36 family metallopeptidase [unclassified Knoellia]|uniref:M36 family metallopeptidase n=1 Tax=Knoellia altitudinis TaxID=3404795 RepID=UPI00360A257F